MGNDNKEIVEQKYRAAEVKRSLEKMSPEPCACDLCFTHIYSPRPL